MADCVVVGWLQKFLFSEFREIFTNLILCLPKFSSNFAKFKIILSKFSVLQNFDNAVLQPPYGGVE